MQLYTILCKALENLEARSILTTLILRSNISDEISCPTYYLKCY